MGDSETEKKGQIGSQEDSTEEFLRIISHQLKSPINAIRTLLDTITTGNAGEVPEKTRFIIEKAARRSDEARDMIDDLLNYERYSEGQRIERDEFDICETFYNLHTHYMPIASESGVSLHADCPTTAKVILDGDRSGLEHAFRNLIENAIKYTPASGSATFRAVVDKIKGVARVEVSDTGYGISASELQSIFEPFYRSIKLKSSITGTGLGLSIVKRVVEAHGGTVSVSSKEQIGTTFTVELPYIRVESREQPRRNQTHVVIIGGVTAGPKAAARLRRLDEDLAITIIEKGRFLSYSGCGLPSYISGKVSSARELMSTSDSTTRDVGFFESIKNIEVMSRFFAYEVNRIDRIVKVRNVDDGIESDIPYDILVLATGALPAIPPIPGVDSEGVYTLRSLEDAEAIKREFSSRNAKDVFIIGGGLIGITTAEELIETGARITILEKKNYILLSLLDQDIANKIQEQLSLKGIKILTGVDIIEINRGNNGLLIKTENATHRADLAILSTGVKPNAELAQKAGLAIGQSGGIQINDHLLTSDDRIYAVGDCAESMNVITGQHEYWPLGSVSTKMGRIAADNIAGREEAFTGSIGSAQFTVQDLNVARTGLTARSALRAGYSVETVVVAGRDRPNYTRGSEYVFLKIVADSKTKRILGAQGYGQGDVVRAIEHISFGITSEMNLSQFFKVDLGYTPAYGNPVHISQTACLVLHNKIEGLLRTISSAELSDSVEHRFVIDVSPRVDHERGSIPGSLNIPLERIRFETIPFGRGAEIILYSRTSAGAYEAYRYLQSKGFTDLKVLEGGHQFWSG